MAQNAAPIAPIAISVSPPEKNGFCSSEFSTSMIMLRQTTDQRSMAFSADCSGSVCSNLTLICSPRFSRPSSGRRATSPPRRPAANPGPAASLQT